MTDESRIWIVTSTDSEYNSSATIRVKGTKAQVKQFLFDSLKAARDADIDRFHEDDGHCWCPTKPSDIKEKNGRDTVLHSRIRFSDYTVDYTARPEEPPIKLGKSGKSR